MTATPIKSRSSIWDPLGGRKFVGFLLALGCSTWLTFADKLDGSAYQYIVIAISGTLATANVAQKRLLKNQDGNTGGEG